MTLVSLVYASPPTHNMGEDELESILTVSRENNTAFGVTGMLLYRRGLFIQALEGEQTVVDDLFAKIRLDPRHRNVVKITESPIEERAFGDWSMGFNRGKDDTIKTLDGYSDIMTFDREIDFFVKRPDRAARLLDNFRTARH